MGGFRIALKDWSTVLRGGELDRWILRPGCFADEEFHRSITELLEDWSAAARPPCYEAVQIIGERWSQRGVELREFMSRKSVPFGFYDCATDEAHELLLAHNLTLAVARLPIVIVQFRPDLVPSCRTHRTRYSRMHSVSTLVDL